MKVFRIVLIAGALLCASVLPTHGKFEEISRKDTVLREVNPCNNIHGCRGPYEERSYRRDLVSLAWKRASGEGAAGEGAVGEGAGGGKGSGGGEGGAEGEGAQGGGAQAGGAHGEGAQGQGAEGEGTQGEPPSNQPPGNSPPPGEPPSSPSEPSEYLVGSDGSLPDRNSDDVQSDNSNQASAANQEILPLSEYKTKGQGYYDLMMQAINRGTKREPTYDSFDIRYRLKSDLRSPVAEDQDEMAFLLYLDDIAKSPGIGIDLKAEDWTYDRLISKGHEDNIDTEEEDATLVTYGSKSQKTIIVYMADSVDNDIPALDNPTAQQLPNSELTFQLLQRQAGDEVSDTRLIIHHPINQKGTRAVLADAHQSKGIAPDAMGTWTAADGDVFRNILGTRNGRPGVFLLTDHPTAMKCKIVSKIYTWARIPKDKSGNAAIAIELGAGPVTC